uniref:CUB and sushi domain-containing protein 3 n=1 Tax=Magallana gigas TaxID=29159 RepID=A0A8W8JHB7_MAGGI
MASNFVEFSIYGKLYFLWILCIVKLSKGTSITLTCPEGWVLSGTMCYRLYGQDTLTSSTWDNAYRVCKGNGAEMVTVDDFFTNQNVGDFASAQNTNKFWTGMSEKGVTTQNGVAMTWNMNVAASIYQGQWSMRNPDKAHGDCVYIEKKDGEYVWTINSCLMKMAFVCQRTPCLPQSFHCDNGRCVNSNWRCDGVDDCGDFSDEVECAGRCTYLLDTASSGRIQSPNHPSNYQPSRVCTWTIVGPEGSNIYLEFTSFNTEKDTDIVEVLIGGRTESTARSVARLSGQPSLSTARYRSYNNYMIIRFSTDSQTEKVGFTANYNSSRDWYPRELYMTAGTTVSILEPPLFSSHGSIAYLGNRDYVWIIKAEERQKIVTLERMKIDLTGDDVIEIRDGDSGSAPLLEKYTASNNDNVDLPLAQSEPIMGKRFVFSTSNVMYVIMRTSGSTSGTGFSFQFKQGCVARYTADAGEITSPGYPNVNYANFQTCTWTIDIPSGKGVKVMLDRSKGFEIADNEDFIQVYTGTTDDSGIAAHRSGAGFTTISLSNDQPFHSPNGKMFIRFKSTAVTNKKGFRLLYSIDCPDPGLTEASEVNPSQTAVQLRQFDNEFTVSCKNGYSFQSDELNLRTARMKCMFGGKWLVEQRTRSIPQCKPNYCGEPVAVENGYISHSSGVVFGSFVTFTCFPGFTLLGSANITCQANQWTSSPRCVSVNCPPPHIISNGHRSSSNNQYAAIVNYTCNAGYQLIGAPILFCLSTGQWTASAPECIKVTCPIPRIKYGRVLSSSLLQFQEILTVTCVLGYMVNGSTTITCGKDRNFDVVPNCIAEVCFSESLQPTSNAARSCIMVGGNVTCTYVCKAGYIYYDGTTSKQYHCSGANKWSPTANPEDCLLYEAPSYKATIDVQYVTTNTLAANCKNGFENMLVAYNITIAKAIDDKCKDLNPGNFFIRSFTSSTLSYKTKVQIFFESLPLKSGHPSVFAIDLCLPVGYS